MPFIPAVAPQAPLTTKDTAVLSGSLSTHNGNGGGTINLALRRVTSAQGWGEVRSTPSNITLTFWNMIAQHSYLVRLFLKQMLSWTLMKTSCNARLSVATQVEIGAGDTHGPLLGLKLFRNLTPRSYVLQ